MCVVVTQRLRFQLGKQSNLLESKYQARQGKTETQCDIVTGATLEMGEGLESAKDGT